MADDKIKKLFDVITRDGYYDKSFEEFQVQFQDEGYQTKVFDVVTRDGLFDKTFEEFKSMYASPVVEEVVEKKNPNDTTSDSVSEDGGLEQSDTNIVPEIVEPEVEVEPEAYSPDYRALASEVPGVAEAEFDNIEREKTARGISNREQIAQDAIDNQADLDIRVQAEQEQEQIVQDARALESGDIAANDIEFQAALENTTPDSINQDEDDAIPYFTRLYAKYGFVFTKSGIGDAMMVYSPYSADPLEIDLDTFFSDSSEAEKLKRFVRDNAKKPDEAMSDEEMSEMNRANKARTMRTNARINDDGTESTVLMASGEVDGKFVAYPTLFPRDGGGTVDYGSDKLWWDEKSGMAAFEEAKLRGEVFTFETEDEAQEFAEGSWKEIDTLEAERNDFFRKNGQDYDSYRKAYNRLQEVREELFFLSDSPYKQKYLSEEDKETYGYFYVNGVRRSDSDTRYQELTAEANKLRDVVQDTDLQELQEDFDVHIQKGVGKITQEAIQQHNATKQLAVALNDEAMTGLGVGIDDVKDFVPTTIREKRLKETLTTQIAQVRNAARLASNKYDVAETWFDSKFDRQIRDDFVSNHSSIANSWEKGMATGNVGNIILENALGIRNLDDGGDIKDSAKLIVQYLQEAETGKQGRAEYRWHQARGFQESWNAFKNDPVELSVSLAANSISMMLPYGWKIVGASAAAGTATGAAIGAGGFVTGPGGVVTTGAGALAGLSYGVRTGMAATSLAMEYTTAVMDAVRNQGFKPMDEQSLVKALQKKEVWDEGFEIGLKRGIPIAMMDMFSTGLAGRIFKPGVLAGAARKITYGVSERLVFDPLTEGLGELAAQVSAGQGIDGKEIAAEMIGAIGSKGPNAVMNMYFDSRMKVNFELANNLTDLTYLSKLSYSDKRIMNWSNKMKKLGHISSEQNKRIEDNLGFRREARDLMSVGETKVVDTATNQVVDPAIESRLSILLSARSELQSTTNRKEIFGQKIKDINAEINEIVSSKSLRPLGQQVQLEGMEVPSTNNVNVNENDLREGISRYMINGKQYTQEGFLAKLAKMSNRRLLKASIQVDNDDETGAILDEQMAALDTTEEAIAAPSTSRQIVVDDETGVLVEREVEVTPETAEQSSTESVETKRFQDSDVILKEETFTVTDEDGGRVVTTVRTNLDGSLRKAETESFDADGNSLGKGRDISLADNNKVVKNGLTAEQLLTDRLVEGEVIEKTERSGTEINNPKRIAGLTTNQKQKLGIETETTKTETDAVQESSTESVDAQEQTGNSQEVGEGLQVREESTQENQTEDNQQTVEVEEKVETQLEAENREYVELQAKLKKDLAEAQIKFKNGKLSIQKLKELESEIRINDENVRASAAEIRASKKVEVAPTKKVESKQTETESLIEDLDMEIENKQEEITAEQQDTKEAIDELKKKIVEARKRKGSKEKKAEIIEDLKSQIQDAREDGKANIEGFKEDIKEAKREQNKLKKKAAKKAPAKKKPTKKQVAEQAAEEQAIQDLNDELGMQELMDYINPSTTPETAPAPAPAPAPTENNRKVVGVSSAFEKGRFNADENEEGSIFIATEGGRIIPNPDADPKEVARAVNSPDIYFRDSGVWTENNVYTNKVNGFKVVKPATYQFVKNADGSLDAVVIEKGEIEYTEAEGIQFFAAPTYNKANKEQRAATEQQQEDLRETADKMMDEYQSQDSAENTETVSGKKLEESRKERPPIKVTFTENTNLLAKIKKFKLKNLVGKAINLLMADKLKVTLKNPKKPYNAKTNPYTKMGGNFFPLMEGLFGKVAWASITDSAATKIILGAMESDSSVVYNMGSSGIDSNIVMAEDLDSMIPDADKAEVFELIQAHIAKSKNKNIMKVQSVFENATNLLEAFKSIQDLDVKVRASAMTQILPDSLETKASTDLNKKMQSFGISLEVLRANNTEQFTDKLPIGALTMVVEVTNKAGVRVRDLKKKLDKRFESGEITQKEFEQGIKDIVDSAKMSQEQQTQEGMQTHNNYPVYIRGRAIAVMEETTPFYNVIEKYKSQIAERQAGKEKKKSGKVKKEPTKTEQEIYDLIKKGKQIEDKSVPASKRKEKIAKIHAVATEILETLIPKIKTAELRNKSKAILKDILKSGNSATLKILLNKLEIPFAKMVDYSYAQALAAAGTSASTTGTTAYTVTKNLEDSYDNFITLLSKSFPNLEVLATQEAFDAFMKEPGVVAVTTKGQRTGGQIYGAVYQGKLYLNPEAKNFNTPIHEFGHIWNSIAKIQRPELYQKGLELVKADGAYTNRIENDPAYKRIIAKMKKDGATDAEIAEFIAEEALATAIGDKGQSFVNAAQGVEFKNWLSKLYGFVKSMVGLSKYTNEQFQNITLDEFVQGVVVDLLSGEQVFTPQAIDVLSEQLQLMTSNTNMSLQGIVAMGRQNNMPDASIIAVLKKNGFTDMKEINEALRTKLDNLETMPREFENIEEGVEAGRTLFEDVRQKLNRFANLDEKGNVTNKRTKTFSEIRAKAVELLQNEPVFQNQAKRIQLELLSAFDRKLGIRSNPSIRQKISEVRARLKDIYFGEKSILAVQRKMRMAVRSMLPKSENFTRGTVNRLTKLITDTTEKNYPEQMEKLLKEIESKRALMKTELLKKMMNLVEKKAKVAITASNKRKSTGLDAIGQSYFAEVKRVLKLAISDDVDGLQAMMNEVNQAELEQAIEQVRINNDPNALPESKTPLTTDQRKLIDKQMAIDTFGDVVTMELEDVNSLFNEVKLTRAESIARLNSRRAERRGKVTVIKDAFEAQMAMDYKELFYEDGTVKSKGALISARKTFRQQMKDNGFFGGLTNWLQQFAVNNKYETNSVRKFMRQNLTHFGSINNILDRGKEGMFTKTFFNRLNQMAEETLAGVFRTEKILDSMAKSLGVPKKNFRTWRNSIGEKPISISGIIDSNAITVAENKIQKIQNSKLKTPAQKAAAIKKINENLKKLGQDKTYEGRFTPDQALRIYALSKNSVQRSKLERQGITDAKLEEIKKFIGADGVKMVDMSVDYLSNTYFEGINSVYAQNNDVNLRKVENYFPTKTISNRETSADMVSGDFNQIFTAENAPALKERTDTTGAIDLNLGFTEVMEEHILSMEKYKAYASGVKEINEVLKSSAIQTVLKETGLLPLFKQSLNYAINPDSGVQLSDNVVNRLQSRFTAYALAFKAIQILKQATSFVQAFEDYSFKGKGQSTQLQDGVGFFYDYAVVILNARKNIRESQELSATFKQRMRKGMEGDLSGLVSGGRTVRAKNRKDLRGKVSRGFDSASGAFTVAGDALGVMGYKAAYNRNIKNGMKKADALDAFNEFNSTQQTRRSTEKIGLQQNTGFAQRFFTMFGSTLYLQMNKVGMSMNNMMRDFGRGGPKAVKNKDVRAFVLNAAAANVLFTTAAYLPALISGKDDDRERAFNEIVKSALGLNVLMRVPLFGGALEAAECIASGGYNCFPELGINPLEGLSRKIMKLYKKSDKDALDYAIPIIEILIKAQLDAPIALAKLIGGDTSGENVMDLTGIANSYRPEEFKASGKAKKNVRQTPESSKSKSKKRKSSTPKTDADKERAKRKKAYLQRSRN